MTSLALNMEAYSTPPEPRSQYTFELFRSIPGSGSTPTVIEVSFSVAEMASIAMAHEVQEAHGEVLGWEPTGPNNQSARDPLLHFAVPWALSLTDRSWSLRRLQALDAQAKARLAEAQPSEITAALEMLIDALAPLIPLDEDITAATE